MHITLSNIRDSSNKWLFAPLAPWHCLMPYMVMYRAPYNMSYSVPYRALSDSTLCHTLHSKVLCCIWLQSPVLYMALKSSAIYIWSSLPFAPSLPRPPWSHWGLCSLGSLGASDSGTLFPVLPLTHSGACGALEIISSLGASVKLRDLVSLVPLTPSCP